MKILILSDQHIHNRNDPKSGILKSLLKKVRQEVLHPGVEELWLLGDVFDMMIGSFAFWEKFHAELFEELKQWSKSGKKIVYIEGNHDFLIKNFLETLDVEVYENPTWYMLPQSHDRVYLAHGDEVDSRNLPYIKWRNTVRSNSFRWVVKNCPPPAAEKMLLPLGEKLSRQSRALNKLENVEYYRQMFRDFAHNKFSEGARGVFLGHSHQHDLYQKDGGSGPFYLNLGTWLEGVYRYGIWDLSKQKSIEVFSY